MYNINQRSHPGALGSSSPSPHYVLEDPFALARGATAQLRSASSDSAAQVLCEVVQDVFVSEADRVSSAADWD